MTTAELAEAEAEHLAADAARWRALDAAARARALKDGEPF